MKRRRVPADALASSFLGRVSDLRRSACLQVVSYSNGQQFGLHHDLGPLRLSGDDESDDESEQSSRVGSRAGREDAEARVQQGGAAEGPQARQSQAKPESDGDTEATLAPTADGSCDGAGTRNVRRASGSAGGAAGSTPYEAACKECGMWVRAPPGPRRLVTLFVYLNSLPDGCAQPYPEEKGLALCSRRKGFLQREGGQTPRA